MLSLTQPTTANASPKFPLRYRFIAVVALLLALLAGAIGISLGYQQAISLKEQIQQQGQTVARSIAASTLLQFMTYNGFALDKAAEETANGKDILYIILLDKEKRVVGTNLTERELDALPDHGDFETARELVFNNQSALEVAYPVVDGSPPIQWGTIRVGLSLAGLNSQIRNTQLIILAAALATLLVGVMLSILFANRITRPLSFLVDATVSASQGNLKQKIDISTNDEVEILARNFTHMISEIRIQQEALADELATRKRLQEYLQEILVSMDDGLLTLGLDGTVLSMNPAAKTILDLDENHPDNMQLKEICSTDNSFYRFVSHQLEAPRSTTPREVTYTLHDSEVKNLLVRTSILSPQDQETQLIVTMTDITLMRELEAKIRHSERLAALGTLAAGIAHEVKNPLTGIKTFVDILPLKMDKPSFIERFQRTVPREIKRIQLLLEELMELTRTPEYIFTEIDLHEMVEQTTDLLRLHLETHNTELEINIEEGLRIRADEDQFIKILNNLILNAQQAMPRGGTITISAEAKGDHALLSVEDTGIGIPDDKLKTIFDPFFSTKDGGTGLGLATTHKVVSEHRGTIVATSKLGQGTTFLITVPLWSETD